MNDDMNPIAGLIITLIMLALAFYSLYNRHNGDTIDYSNGVNGYTEIRCIDGLKFTVGRSGSASQMLDANGKGIPCQKK